MDDRTTYSWVLHVITLSIERALEIAAHSLGRDYLTRKEVNWIFNTYTSGLRAQHRRERLIELGVLTQTQDATKRRGGRPVLLFRINTSVRPRPTANTGEQPIPEDELREMLEVKPDEYRWIHHCVLVSWALGVKLLRKYEDRDYLTAAEKTSIENICRVTGVSPTATEVCTRRGYLVRETVKRKRRYRVAEIPDFEKPASSAKHPPHERDIRRALSLPLR